MPDHTQPPKAAARSIRLVNHGDGTSKRKQIELKRFGPAHDIWTQANETLCGWAECAPSGDLFHKVEVYITYENGVRANVCVLLQRENWSEPDRMPDVGAQARRAAEMFAGLRRPEHFTAEGYQYFLHSVGHAAREWYGRLVREHEMPDSFELAAGAGVLAPFVPPPQPPTDITETHPPA